jgi:hypothetical protein
MRSRSQPWIYVSNNAIKLLDRLSSEDQRYALIAFFAPTSAERRWRQSVPVPRGKIGSCADPLASLNRREGILPVIGRRLDAQEVSYPTDRFRRLNQNLGEPDLKMEAIECQQLRRPQIPRVRRSRRKKVT